MRTPGILGSVLVTATPAAAAPSAGFELEIGMARGPYRYEGVTGQGSPARAETALQSLALNLAAHGGFELDRDYFLGARLAAGVLPTLDGGMQSTHFHGGLHARGAVAAWRAPADDLHFGLALGAGTLALAYSVDGIAREDEIRYEDSALYGPVGDVWVAHPFGGSWSVGVVAGFAWLTSERARLGLFSAGLRLSWEPWQRER